MWEAENVPTSKRDSDGFFSSSSSLQKGTKGSNSRLSETPEAAMARLTSSYSDAMVLIRDLYALSKKMVLDNNKKVSTLESNTAGYDADSEELQEHYPGSMSAKDDTRNDTYELLVKAAHKARDAFESKILLDPLMKQYAKNTLSRIKDSSSSTVSTNTNSSSNRDNHYFTSLAHVKALKQLMYATLVNYADLLLACIRYDPTNQNQYMDKDSHLTPPFTSILHRGIVPTLDALMQPHFNPTATNTTTMTTTTILHTCWDSYGETMEQTIRLALVAYCDASDIDASDPILWLKLACASRRLSVITDTNKREEDNDDYESTGYYCWYNWNYARLERYAIERGMMTLKKGLPPNRSLVKAFQEIEMDVALLPYGGANYSSSITTMDNRSTTKQDVAELWIDLPKYSWTTLGRYLLHACKDPYSNEFPGLKWIKSWNTTGTIKEDFGSPMVRIKISPLLVIPHGALIQICDYLGSYIPTSSKTNNKRPSKDIAMLESTSRIISAAITNARSLVEKETKRRIRCIEQEMEQLMKNDSEHNDELTSVQDSKQNRQQPTLSLSQRSSARVRSNLITSNKQTERSTKRKNVEYCLVGALLPCTSDHPLYSSIVNEKIQWETLACFSKLTDDTSSTTAVPQSHSPSSNEKRNGRNTSSNLNHMSHPLDLSEFLTNWTNGNSGPSEVLYHLINHVAYHVEEIYSMEIGSLSDVTQCIMECYEFLSNDYSSKNTLLPCWFGKEKFNNTEDELSDIIQVLATNLLFVELKMRSVEQKSAICHSFTDEIHIVRTSLPILFHLCENLDTLIFNDGHVKRRYTKLKARTLFLAATFYVWWSRHTDQGNQIKELETLALDLIDEIIRIFESQSELRPFTIETKHLASLVRSGDVWSQLNIASINRYKDEFQFCTVLSRVREQFDALLSTLKKDGRVYFEIPADGTLRDSFESIKQDLLSRYSLDSELSTSNFDELADDFVSLHISGLKERRDSSLTESDDDDLSDFHILLPSSSQTRVPLDKLSSPSVLTMLLLCYHQTSDNYSTDLLKCFTRLVFISLDKRKSLLYGADSIDLTNIAVDDSDSVEDVDMISSKTSDPRIYMHLVNLILEILIDVVKSEEVILHHSKLIMKTINAAFDASICCSDAENSIAKERVLPDIDCLQYVNKLVAVMINNGNNSMRIELTSFILALLTKAIIHGKQVFSILANAKLKKISRSECHRLIISRAKVVGMAMIEFTALLSSSTSTILNNGTVQESYLIQTLTNISSNEPTCALVAQLIGCVTWFWEFSKSGFSTEPLHTVYTNLTNTIHKSAAKMLMVPSSLIIISLCNLSQHGLDGSISKSFLCRDGQMSGEHQDIVDHPSDYFDSDDSAIKWESEHVLEAEISRKRRLLQSLKKAVQCIGLVYSECYENRLSSVFVSLLSPIENVSDFLSQVTVRVLTNISELVLNLFSQPHTSLGIWADSYPSGFQNSGMQLDLILHKAYNRLYGIQLTAPHFYTLIKSDTSVPSMSFISLESESNIITHISITTVIQLYRCLRRAYSNARRTIPSELLDFISSNLPPPDDESESVKAIQSFLFKSRKEKYLIENPDALLDDGNQSVGKIPTEFPSWIFTDSSSTSTMAIDSESCASFGHEIDTVRKGLWQYIADEASTTTSHSVPMDDQNGQDLSDQMQERTIISCKLEKNADEKVFAIIHALHYEPTDANKWFRMANAICFKLNHICDRLIPAEASYDANQFCVHQVDSPEQRTKIWKKTKGNSKSLSNLLLSQKMVYKQVEKRRHKLRDVNLSGFVEHQWSNPDSVRSLEQNLLRNAMGRDKRVLERLQSLFDQGEYSKWQFEWGLHFINGLRAIQQRCFDIALYLSKKRGAETGDENIISEVSEAYATSYYDAIGFNPEPITVYEKRQRAMRSKILFEAALSSQLESSKACKTSEIMPTWELRYVYLY